MSPGSSGLDKYSSRYRVGGSSINMKLVGGSWIIFAKIGGNPVKNYVKELIRHSRLYQ
jgi:hypothetical protein